MARLGVDLDLGEAGPVRPVAAEARLPIAVDRDAGRGQGGTNDVRLDLARQDGVLKIIRESGEPVSDRR